LEKQPVYGTLTFGQKLLYLKHGNEYFIASEPRDRALLLLRLAVIQGHAGSTVMSSTLKALSCGHT